MFKKHCLGDYEVQVSGGKMKTKKPKLLMAGHTDEIYTPNYALDPLIPFIKRNWIIWECAWGQGALATHLKERGFNVVGHKEDNFLGELVFNEFDCIITNPPYSKKDKFIERCFEIGKPFALLMPLTALEGIKRGSLFKKYGLQLIVPNRRINFITPNGGKSSWFATAWFCFGLNLPKDLMFVELNNKFKSREGK